jgi:hypothetical protein
MQLWKKITELTVTQVLRLGENATIIRKLVNGDDNIVDLPRTRGLVLTAARTLTEADAGVVYLGSATGFALTLPSPRNGLKFRFVVSVAPTSGSHTVVTASSANVIEGPLASADLNAASDTGSAAASDTVTFVVNKALKGDWVELAADGTNWFASGACKVFDAVTLTQAS